MTRILPYLLSVSLVVAALGSPVHAEGEAAPDELVLATGARLACTIVELSDSEVRAQVGEKTYTFERDRLQATIRDGTTLAKPAMLRFVRSLAPHLAGEDETIREASKRALEALGDSGKQAIAEIGETLRDAKQRRALGLSVPKPPLAPAIRARIQEETKRARRLIDLAPEQEAGFEGALETFFRSLTTGGDASKARAALDEALAKILTAAQLEKLRTP